MVRGHSGHLFTSLHIHTLTQAMRATKGFGTSEWCKKFLVNFRGEEGKSGRKEHSKRFNRIVMYTCTLLFEFAAQCQLGVGASEDAYQLCSGYTLLKQNMLLSTAYLRL